jgi:hydroxypyruvate isomerase
MLRRDFLLQAAAATAAAVATRPGTPKPKVTSSVMLWTLKGSFEDRVQTAARAGMQSIELVAEYAGWTAADCASRKRFVSSFGLGIDTLLATPNWTKRSVSMLDPAQRDNFLADVKNAIDSAKRLDIPQIILMSGNEIPGRTREEQYASLLEGSRRAADLAAAADLTLIIEPLNTKVDHKGYYLNTAAEGLKLVKAVDNPHFRLLFDLYHEQTEVGDPTKLAVEAIPYTAVFHVADSPGRHDPGTGRMNYIQIYKAIAKAGYNGIICMEYLPQADQVASLIKSTDSMRAAIA